MNHDDSKGSHKDFQSFVTFSTHRHSLEQRVRSALDFRLGHTAESVPTPVQSDHPQGWIGAHHFHIRSRHSRFVQLHFHHTWKRYLLVSITYYTFNVHPQTQISSPCRPFDENFSFIATTTVKLSA